jgi:hypothetical protein
MTVEQLFEAVGRQPWIVLAVFVAMPLLAFVVGRIHGPGQGAQSPWKYIYSLLVYLICIPGILASVVTGYSLFFVRTNLLQANVLVYFLPIVSMVVTLALIGKSVEFTRVPGFDRLSGLIVMITVSFVIALAITKTRIWLLFGASIEVLFAIAVFAFALLRWSSHALFRRKDETRLDLPDM